MSVHARVYALVQAEAKGHRTMDTAMERAKKLTAGDEQIVVLEDDFGNVLVYMQGVCIRQLHKVDLPT